MKTLGVEVPYFSILVLDGDELLASCSSHYIPLRNSHRTIGQEAGSAPELFGQGGEEMDSLPLLRIKPQLFHFSLVTMTVPCTDIFLLFPSNG